MSTVVVYNGVDYDIPAYGDTGYAQGPGNLSSYLIALATGGVNITGSQTITGAKTFVNAGGVGFGGVPTLSSSNGLDIYSGGLGIVIGAESNLSTRTNNTTKIALIAIPHYANAQNPFVLIGGSSSATDNSVIIGGGSIGSNAATTIALITGATTTTPTGTNRLIINSAGLSTFSGNVAITPTTNQIVLGTTNTTTINSTAPAASRVYTIPDAGATASFVMTEGNQTINGTKTFGSKITGTITGHSDADLALTGGTVSGQIIDTVARTDTKGSGGLVLSDAQKYSLRLGLTGNTFNIDSFDGATWTTPLTIANTGAATFSADVSLASTKKLYLDGGTDTYIFEEATNRITMVTGGTTRFRLDNSGFLNILGLNIYVTATNKLYLDGGSDSYITEVGSNVIEIVTGGATAAQFQSNGGCNIFGTNTNNSAAAGYVGEYIESLSGTVNLPASGSLGDATSISLTAGDWDVSVMAYFARAGSTFTSTTLQTGISTTSGNSGTGLVTGVNMATFNGVVPTGFTDFSTSVPSYRMSLASTTTVYLKMYSDTYTSGQPTFKGRISARRRR